MSIVERLLSSEEYAGDAAVPDVAHDAVAVLGELTDALDGMLQVFGVRESNLRADSFASSAEVELCNKARAALAKVQA